MLLEHNFPISNQELKKLFLYYNYKYFDNQLDTNLKIVNCKNSDYKGKKVMLAKIFITPDIDIVKKICIKKEYIGSLELLKSVLLHEMIHAYLWQKKRIVGHSIDFQELADIITKKENLKIPIRSSEYMFDLAKELLKKRNEYFNYIVFLLNNQKIKYIIKFNSKYKKEDIVLALKNKLNLKYLKINKLIIIKSNNSVFNLFRKSTLKNIKLNEIKFNSVERLLYRKFIKK